MPGLKPFLYLNITISKPNLVTDQVEDFERICARVSTVRDEAVAKGARIVHRTAQVGHCH